MFWHAIALKGSSKRSFYVHDNGFQGNAISQKV